LIRVTADKNDVGIQQVFDWSVVLPPMDLVPVSGDEVR